MEERQSNKPRKRWEKKTVESFSFPYREEDFWVSNEEQKVELLAEVKTGHAASKRE